MVMAYDVLCTLFFEEKGKVCGERKFKRINSMWSTINLKNSFCNWRTFINFFLLFPAQLIEMIKQGHFFYCDRNKFFRHYSAK